ncbi:hypothetical protein OSCI_790003 [Kamptonema sp. PCC 6506]|nr:hypothetical protein OSCI_790003 [Kamptonema sp. PCC 6506]
MQVDAPSPPTPFHVGNRVRDGGRPLRLSFTQVQGWALDPTGVLENGDT